MTSQQKQLKEWIEESQYVVFFGGAGVSTESQIPDFRSQDGLYRQKFAYPPERILSHSFYISHKEEFFRFYREKMLFPEAMPNRAHLALAELERQGKVKAVITQNIDGLHQKAGSREVLEIHGSVLRNYCTRCSRSYSMEEILNSEGVPKCVCGGDIKPDVVLYEEGLDGGLLHRSMEHIRKADLMIVGGTSLSVYPAAGLLEYFTGKHLVLINRDKTPKDDYADLIIRDSIGEVLSVFLPTETEK